MRQLYWTKQILSLQNVLDSHNVCYACLKTRRAPLNKLYCLLLLDHGDGRVDVFGHDVATVQHAHGHVLPLARVTVHLRT